MNNYLLLLWIYQLLNTVEDTKVHLLADVSSEWPRYEKESENGQVKTY